MATSASMPDLAAAALLSQSRGHSDPSRFSALLASGSLASNGHSTGAPHPELEEHQPSPVSQHACLPWRC